MLAEKEKLISGPRLVAQLTRRIGLMVQKNYPQDKIYKAMLACIADAPSVDAAPVVHGKWIVKQCGKNPGEYTCYCSECKAEGQLRWSCCPVCEARMKVQGAIVIKPDGVHELSPHRFQEEMKLKNVTVQILRCKDCGEVSIGWYRQDNTEILEKGD